MAVTTTERSGRTRRRSYDARTLKTCVWIANSGKKRIHVPSLKRQLLRMSKDRHDTLGPQWKYWTDRSLKKLEDNGILQSLEDSSFKLLPKAQKIVSSAAGSHHLSPDDPRIFQDDGDAMWQSAARKVNDDGKPPKTKALRPVGENALAKKCLEKMTKVELLTITRSLSNEVQSLKDSYDSIADSSLDFMDELESQREELREKSAELKRVQDELKETQSREQSQVMQQLALARPITPVAVTRPSAKALTRLASGSFLNTISGQPTPDSSEVDPRSPRLDDLDDFDAQMDDTGQDTTFGHFDAGAGADNEFDDDGNSEVASSLTLVRSGGERLDTGVEQVRRYPRNQQVHTPMSTPPRGPSSAVREIRGEEDWRVMAAKVQELEDILQRERAERDAEKESTIQPRAVVTESNDTIDSLKTDLSKLTGALTTTQSTLTSLQDTHAQLVLDHAETATRSNLLFEDLIKERNKALELELALNSSSSELHRSEDALAHARSLVSGWERKAQSLLDRVEKNREIANRRIATLAKEVKVRSAERDRARREVEALNQRLVQNESVVRLATEQRENAAARANKLSVELVECRRERDSALEHVANLNGRLSQQEQAQAQSSHERNDILGRVAVLETQLVAAQSEKSILATRIIGLESSVAEREGAIERITRERDSAIQDAATLRRDLERKELDQSILSKQLERTRLDLKTSTASIVALEEKLIAGCNAKTSLEAELSDLRLTKVRLEQDLNAKSAEIENRDLALSMTRASELSLHTTLKKQKVESDLAAKNHRRVLANLRQDISFLSGALDQKKDELIVLKKSSEAREREFESLENELKECNERLEDAEARAEALDEEAEQLREAAARDREVIDRMKDVYKAMKRKQEEEFREMDATISSLNVSPLPSRKRKRMTEFEGVRDSGIGL